MLYTCIWFSFSFGIFLNNLEVFLYITIIIYSQESVLQNAHISNLRLPMEPYFYFKFPRTYKNYWMKCQTFIFVFTWLLISTSILKYVSQPVFQPHWKVSKNFSPVFFWNFVLFKTTDIWQQRLLWTYKNLLLSREGRRDVFYDVLWVPESADSDSLQYML